MEKTYVMPKTKHCQEYFMCECLRKEPYVENSKSFSILLIQFTTMSKIIK